MKQRLVAALFSPEAESVYAMIKTNADYYPKQGRVILHIDMNAFYCSVHEAVNPELYKGKAIAVAGSVELRRGIIVTSSYKARGCGVKTGMLVGQALKLCPDLIIIQPNFHLYREFSQNFITIAGSYSPLLEAVSIDECFMDITGSKTFGTPMEIANNLQQRIRDELQLPCSIGVAPNKLLAKIASDMQKPNGLTVLRLRDVPTVLWGKPCDTLYGVGGKTAEKLNRVGIRTIGELAKAEETFLVKEFGQLGLWLKQAAHGMDDSPVNPVSEASKSVGHTTTLPADFINLQDIRRVFLNLADQTARRMRRQGLVASTIQITIRDPLMKTITRACTIPAPTESFDEIYREACKLFTKHWPPDKPVRLLGITLTNLQAKSDSAIQLDLFDYEQQPKKEQLNEAMDRIRDKFGENAILTAGMLGDDPSTLIRNHKLRGTSLQKDPLNHKKN